MIYESRLELEALLLSDFDIAVHRIVAQPFMFRAEIGGKIRRHIPDYLLDTDAGRLWSTLFVVNACSIRGSFNSAPGHGNS